MKTPKSSKLFARAVKVLPGGVNSPVRAFKAVGGSPLFIAKASGAHISDIDGHTYIDYVGSWGPMIHGHAPSGLTTALARQAKAGTSFGAPSPLEVELAELVRDLVPSMERVRFVSSGTEATMSAARVARGATGRDKIVKFEGCYHGHADAFLVQAGSGALTFGTPTSPGVPAGAVADTLLATFNDLASIDTLVRANPRHIAALIVEPVAGNMGVVLPQPGFLQGLRTICDREGILLIFDEVMTGFRLSAGGAQALYDVKPDLTCLGKIIGGGLPVAAYGGRADVMDRVSPAGPVYQAGTLSGNPLAMTAGLWSLKRLTPRLYKHLSAMGHHLAGGLADAARDAGVALQVNALGSMITPFFTSQRVSNFQTATTSDTTAFGVFFRGMLDQGVYLPPSQYEAWFISGAHTKRDIEKTIDAARAAMALVARSQKKLSVR
ncbi:MAG TPA: glutamate-1-semialdehyde 2,1-aminomutase [Vicinamibacterales bacterium]|nr:glutamate-1-semialdehyde 2,1-aminomutase [Vicinamibacterales bacterium]